MSKKSKRVAKKNELRYNVYGGKVWQKRKNLVVQIKKDLPIL